MAHFAKVQSGIVTKVIVAEADFFNHFVDDTPGEWVQTSYNTKGGIHYDPQTGQPSADQTKALRKNFAGIGFLYDGVGFYPPKPHQSWTLNDQTYMWESPVAYPDDGNVYIWDDEAYRIDSADPKTAGWVLVGS